MSEFNPSVPEKAPSSESSHTPAESVKAHAAVASQMASNTKDSPIDAMAAATVAATDTDGREPQGVKEDVHAPPSSALQATNDANGHPLARYHSFVYDTVTWKFPRASAIAFFLIVSGILASQFVNFSRFAFRILWLSFASTATIEAISKLVTGRGLRAFDAIFSELGNILNFLVLEFQRLLFAEKTAHTAVAFFVCFLAYKLVRYVPLWGLTLMGTVSAFAIPPLYLRNQAIIDKHISHAQNMAAERVKMAQDMAGERVGVVSEKAKLVTSEWGRKAGIELPWSPQKTSAGNPPAARASGVEALQGLNVPQGTPQKKVDPAKVPLPDTPAAVAQR